MKEQKFCQSCAMPMTSEEQFGTNENGSKNLDYCIYCYKDGDFVEKVGMDEFIEKCSQFGEQAGMTNAEMRVHCQKVFPELKRWKCTCTEACASGYNPDCTCENPECHCREQQSRLVIVVICGACSNLTNLELKAAH